MSQSLSYSSIDADMDKSCSGCKKKQIEKARSINDLIEGGVSIENTDALVNKKKQPTNRVRTQTNTLNVVPKSPDSNKQLNGGKYSFAETGVVETVIMKDQPNKNGTVNYMMILADDKDKDSIDESPNDKNPTVPMKPSYPVMANWDYITQFYFGSITVIGLFLIYRMQVKR